MVVNGKDEYRLDIDYIRQKTEDAHLMNASQDCNYSVAFSDDEEYKARKIKDMKEPKYHLRRGQVHGIEDRMTFLTYDRDKYGQLKPVKNIKKKNGVLVEIDPNFYRTA